MLDNFKRWYFRNYTEITWFLIGFLVMGGCSDIGNGNYMGAILSFGVAGINYSFVKK